MAMIVAELFILRESISVQRTLNILTYWLSTVVVWVSWLTSSVLVIQ